MTIRKAIIPVGGWGSRMLPITKTIEKCMLPVGTRPVVDYIVHDCIRAGITDIYFVVSEGSTQVQEYYSHNEVLNTYLRDNGKDDKLPLVTPPQGVSFHYIVQSGGGKYGTAVPVGLVNDYIDEDESVVVLMGDDFLYSTDGENDTARLIEAASDGAAMLGVTIPRENVSRYGVLQLSEAGEYERIVEKPAPEDAPSTLINVSKYVLPKVAIEAAVTIPVNPSRGEYEITDVINQYVADGGSIRVVEAAGQFLDAGTPEGWLHANNVVAGLNRAT